VSELLTECSAALFEFAPVEGRSVVSAFDGGKITSDDGGLLLAATDRAVGLIDRFAGCFTDRRSPELVEHTVATLVGQRIFGIALGYEDVLDQDDLGHDPMMAVLAGKLEARRKNCAPVAGKSTLNRLELGKPQPTPYHKIGHDPQAIENLHGARRFRPFAETSLSGLLAKMQRTSRASRPSRCGRTRWRWIDWALPSWRPPRLNDRPVRHSRSAPGQERHHRCLLPGFGRRPHQREKCTDRM
jgi:hypothetical protein